MSVKSRDSLSDISEMLEAVRRAADLSRAFSTTLQASQALLQQFARPQPALTETLVVGEWKRQAQVLSHGDVGAIRSAFYVRISEWAHEVALNAPEDILSEVLASPSVRSGLVTLLSETAADLDRSPTAELRDQALARGAAAKEALRERAGGFAPTAWVSKHLGISRQAVDKRRKAGKLLAVQAADGTFAYPMCQFTEEGIVPGLEDALAALQVESPWERLSALVNPAPALGGRSVLDVLGTARSETERAQALAVLREFLE